MKKITALAATLMMTAAAVAAQQPRVSNAKLETRSAAAGLDRTFRSIVDAQASAAWIGYAVPAEGERQMCCWDSINQYRDNGCCGVCRLDGKNADSTNITDRNASSAGSGTVKLEGPWLMLVLYRAENRAVQKIQQYSEDCQIDAGGLPVFWLTDVKPGESIALLSAYVRGDARASDDDERSEKRLRSAAITAIALHKDAAADAALERFSAPGQPEGVRGDATFWLGAARGVRGYQVLSRMVREDPSEKIREKAIFGLHVSKQPGAVDAIIRTAKEDASSRVRGQALFWLAQKAGQREVRAISDAIEQDPETDVKKKAVFALSQLPKDEGVPLLIQVARTNKNPAVRKQAMFWLGQSKDPRAVKFFEDILAR